MWKPGLCRAKAAGQSVKMSGLCAGTRFRMLKLGIFYPAAAVFQHPARDSFLNHCPQGQTFCPILQAENPGVSEPRQFTPALGAPARHARACALPALTPCARRLIASITESETRRTKANAIAGVGLSDILWCEPPMEWPLWEWYGLDLFPATCTRCSQSK